MKPESPDNSRQHRGPAFLRGRRPGPLLSALAGVIIVAGLVFLLDQWAPVLHDVLVPIYWLIGLIAFTVILRWIRGRRGKRRTADRRQSERRDADV